MARWLSALPATNIDFALWRPSRRIFDAVVAMCLPVRFPLLASGA